MQKSCECFYFFFEKKGENIKSRPHAQIVLCREFHFMAAKNKMSKQTTLKS